MIYIRSLPTHIHVQQGFFLCVEIAIYDLFACVAAIAVLGIDSGIPWCNFPALAVEGHNFSALGTTDRADLDAVGVFPGGAHADATFTHRLHLGMALWGQFLQCSRGYGLRDTRRGLPGRLHVSGLFREIGPGLHDAGRIDALRVGNAEK